MVPERAVAKRAPAAVAHAARDPADSIVDFAFNPASLTVHAGDTVTWTNTGQQPHTATANNHSFDTGILQHGQSASHTFTQAGTYTYFCTVHPFMHGTIVVLASSSSTNNGGSGSGSSANNAGSGSGSGGSGSAGSGSTGSGSTGSGSTGSGSTGGGSSASGSTLPVTGLNLALTLVCGLGLLASGLVLVRRGRAG